MTVALHIHVRIVHTKLLDDMSAAESAVHLNVDGCAVVSHGAGCVRCAVLCLEEK